jgi:hypothetical protein
MAKYRCNMAPDRHSMEVCMFAESPMEAVLNPDVRFNIQTNWSQNRPRKAFYGL